MPKRSSTVATVAAELEKLSGVPASRMHILELFRGYIHRLMSSGDGVADIRTGDEMFAFEYAPSADPTDDMFVFVYNRYQRLYTSYNTTHRNYFCEGIPRLVRISKKKLSLEHIITVLSAAFWCVLRSSFEVVRSYLSCRHILLSFYLVSCSV